MKNNVLYYSVGPLLYCPANRISITDSLINERFGNRFSLALCLEDTINDDHVEEAEQILISSLSQIFIQHEQKPFYLPKIFIRVRNPQQIQRLTKALGQSIKIVTGFIVPKFSPDNAQSYIEQMTNKITDMEDTAVTEEMEKKRQTKHKVTILTEEELEKAYTYVELNFGKTYLTPAEEKRMNYLMCRELHRDCSLYFTEGILKNPVKRNYQYEYAVRLKNKNIWLYHDKHRIVKQNIASLTDLLRKTLVLKSETQEVLSDRGTIIPSRLWRVGRSSEANLFKRELKSDASDFVVDVLIDASGSQMSRQGDVALQAYIISEALSNVNLPHRVMSFCTFWDYTILHRFREYDDPQSANENIFNYVTSSNNRDGLAIKTAGYGLLQRSEEKKILIVLSDGKPYDVIVNRPHAKNPEPYMGKYAINDTATEVRHLRNLGVSVLGVFAGEEKDLSTEKKIFGKDFAYIRDISNFSRIVGRYLIKQLDSDE